MASADRAALVVLSQTNTRGFGPEEDWHRFVEHKLGTVFDMDSWDVDAALSSWKGIEVDGDGRVVGLILETQNIKGETV